MIIKPEYVTRYSIEQHDNSIMYSIVYGERSIRVIYTNGKWLVQDLINNQWQQSMRGRSAAKFGEAVATLAGHII